MGYTDNKTSTDGHKGTAGKLAKLKGGFKQNDQVKPSGGKGRKSTKK